jgi:hypothetical protein
MRSDGTVISNASVSTAFALWRYVNLKYIKFNIFYSSVSIISDGLNVPNQVPPSQPDPTFRDRVGVLVPMSNILLIILVCLVNFFASCRFLVLIKLYFRPSFTHDWKLTVNIRAVVNITYLPYIVLLWYQCVAPGLLSCSVTLRPDRWVCCRYEVIKRYLYFSRYCCLVLCR